MEIIINGNQAYLKKNTSFEFISENSLFTGSDSYTLTISFPLKGCPQNIAIFGHIHRSDVEKKKVTFNCDIRDKTFFKSGSITITEINEVEVKTQFLEGRCEANFDTSFDDIYLNEMDLGSPNYQSPIQVPLMESLRPYPYNNYVPLPWVNNTSGNLQNEMEYVSSGPEVYDWKDMTKKVTFQPYLLYILEAICDAVGYTGDFSAIENTHLKYLIICNTLPYTWNAHNFATALPHWSLTEFFEQLELLLYGEFYINHKTKHIDFRFTGEMMENTPPVYIDNVVNEYTAEVSREESSDYIGVKNLMYADNDNRYWAYRSCEWFVKLYKDTAIQYNTLRELMNFARTLKMSGYSESSSSGHHIERYTRGYDAGSAGHKLYYAKDVNTYFIMFCYRSEFQKSIDIGDDTYNAYLYYNRLEPINQFGKREVDKDAEDIEIKIVPAWIDDTDDEHGPCIFLEPGEMGSAVSWEIDTDGDGNSTGRRTDGGGGGHFGRRAPASSHGTTETLDGGTQRGTDMDDTDYNEGALAQSIAGKTIERGETKKADAYYDNIYVAFWSGVVLWQGLQPCPIIDKVMTNNEFNYVTNNYYSLRLNQPTMTGNRDNIYSIDGKKKYTFSFIADKIPDTHAIFNIKGGRYLCEKITAKFTEHGMSKLLKGVFYRLED